MFYFKENNKIVAISGIKHNENWVETDKNIMWSYAKCAYVFEEEIPSKEEETKAMLAERSARMLKSTKQNEISQLKANLANTDYVVTKIAEGVATKEDYTEILQQRAEWRAKINELEQSV